MIYQCESQYLLYNWFSMNYPDNLRYTKDHEWIKLEGSVATVGITDFAQRELGDIVYVEVETIGKPLQSGAVFGTVEAVKTVSDLFLPVDGTITELNPELAGAPGELHGTPRLWRRPRTHRERVAGRACTIQSAGR